MGRSQTVNVDWFSPLGWKIMTGVLGLLHLLCSYVVFQDLRHRKPGMSAAWIPLVFLGGIPALFTYGLFRHLHLRESRLE